MPPHYLPDILPSSMTNRAVLPAFTLAAASSHAWAAGGNEQTCVPHLRTSSGQQHAVYHHHTSHRALLNAHPAYAHFATSLSSPPLPADITVCGCSLHHLQQPAPCFCFYLSVHLLCSISGQPHHRRALPSQLSL